MKAFFIQRADSTLADAVIRAETDARANELAGGDGTVREFPANVANAMGVPDRDGCHEGALSRWLLNPTNLFGEPLK